MLVVPIQMDLSSSFISLIVLPLFSTASQDIMHSWKVADIILARFVIATKKNRGPEYNDSSSHVLRRSRRRSAPERFRQVLETAACCSHGEICGIGNVALQ